MVKPEVIKCYQGDDFALDITATDEAGVAIDFSAATFDFAIGNVLDEGDATITGNASGQISLSISAANMALLTADSYTMQLAYTVSGVKTTLFSLALEILDSIL